MLLFIEHLLSVAAFPCFVVLLARPALLEEHPELATNRRITLSHLDALNDRDIATLLGGLVVGLPDEVRAGLVARSEGVPLFAVETVRSLIDRDLVVPRGGQYVLANPESLDLDSIGAPASLHALIAARLDALEPRQRQLVDRGSVIGNAFSREEIAELCSDLDDVEDLLAGLVRLQILSQTTSRFSAEFGQYQFVQSVVRQVAYATLSRRDRRATHLAVAAQTEAMEDTAGDLAPIIAQHYLNAISALPNEPDVRELEERAIAQLERAAQASSHPGCHVGLRQPSPGRPRPEQGPGHPRPPRSRRWPGRSWTPVIEPARSRTPSPRSRPSTRSATLSRPALAAAAQAVGPGAERGQRRRARGGPTPVGCSSSTGPARTRPCSRSAAC